MKPLTQHMNRSLFYKASMLTLSITALVSLLPSSRAQQINPYEGFKVPPLEISSETPYDYKFVLVSPHRAHLMSLKNSLS